jgi:hypothetical protein
MAEYGFDGVFQDLLFQPEQPMYEKNALRSMEFLLMELHQRQTHLEDMIKTIATSTDLLLLRMQAEVGGNRHLPVVAEGGDGDAEGGSITTPHAEVATSMVVSLKPFPFLPVNVAVVPADSTPSVNAYYKLLVTKLADIKNMRGNLFTPKRPYAQSIVARAIIFINRPACFVNERWPSPRPLFQNCAELNMYICKHRQYIHDFFMYAITSKVPPHDRPAMRTDAELAKPHQKKFLLVHWQALFKF